MAKEKKSPKKDKKKKVKVDDKIVFFNMLEVLKEFCSENVMALEPLLEADKDNEAVEERIIKFMTIAKILDSVEQMASMQSKIKKNKE